MPTKEEQLYPEIEEWCKKYLEHKYKAYSVRTTFKTSKIALDSYLKSQNIEIREAIGLSIKIDIVGILQRGNDVKLVFIEVKDRPLTLGDLGQLWGYTQLLNPMESFLVSPSGLGSLEYLFKILKREDLLAYGIKKEKYMHVCKWDTNRKAIDYATIIPKI